MKTSKIQYIPLDKAFLDDSPFLLIYGNGSKIFVNKLWKIDGMVLWRSKFIRLSCYIYCRSQIGQKLCGQINRGNLVVIW
jgi:hypothetical protein